jgi:hypothetical protein
MGTRPRFETFLRSSGAVVMLLCAVGAAASMYVVLVRVPALTRTKQEVLSGTLQGVAVGLLFGIVALLINLTLMARRASLQLRLPDGRGEPEG